MATKKYIKKNRVYYMVLCVLAIICVLSVVYTTMSYGRARIDSDVSLVYRFYKSMIKTKSIYPNTWNAVNGEIYAFTRLPISVLMLSIIKDKSLAIVISNTIVFFTAIFGILWLSKKYLSNDMWLICVPAFCVFLSGEQARIMLFFHAAYCPGAVVFTIVFGLYWLSVIQENKSIWYSIVHSFLLFFMILGGKRLVAEYLIPTIATYIIYILLTQNRNEIKRKDIIINFAKLLVPSGLGYIVYRIVCSTHNMNFGGNSNPNLNININHLIENVRTTLINIISIFGYQSNTDRSIIYNIIAIILATFICAIVPLLQLIELKKLNDKEKVLFVLSVVHNIELIIIILFCDMLQTRYCLSIVFLSLLVATNYCYKKVKAIHATHIKVCMIVCFCLLSLGLCRDLLKLTNGWQERYKAQKQIGEELIAHGIRKGYSSFWNGFPTEVYTNGEIVFGSVDISEASLMKQYSNCDSSCYEYEKGKSCVLLTQEEWDYYYSVDGQFFIEDIIGEPIEAFSIDNPLFNELYDTNRFIVYVFEDDVCDKLTDGLKDGVLIPQELSANAMAIRQGDYISMEPGAVIHGPYKKIAPGEYIVNYKGNDLTNCDIDVVSESLPNNIEYELINKTTDEITVSLIIKNYIEDIQFYITNNTSTTARFDEIVLEKSQ